MSKRKADDAEVERVVRSIGYITMQAMLLEMTKTWSSADFIYAIQRLETDQPHEIQRGQLRELYWRLRAERAADEARVILEETNTRRHTELTRQLEELKKPHWSIVPNFGMTAAVLILTAIGVVAAIIGLRH
jgi:hypothetical protein